jgi:hypothetical protein
MSLALANAATYQASEAFILLDDLGLFDDGGGGQSPQRMNSIGLNF